MINYFCQCYCSSFYGTNIMSVFDGSLESVCTAWRKAVHRIWRIPWKTNNNILSMIAGVMYPDLLFTKRSINFINRAMSSNNIVTKTITVVGMASYHSRMCAYSGYAYTLYKTHLSFRSQKYTHLYFFIKKNSRPLRHA